MKHHLDEKTLELFNDSFETCVAQPRFLERFYEIFIGASPEVQEKFKDTDFKEQIRVVRKSMLMLLMASFETEEVAKEIARLGQSHGRHGMRIGPHLYELWLNSLLQAAKEFDPRWSQGVEASWRKMFDPYINTLKSYS
ncbi:MAG TPA: globin [Acidobacteriota bacterium]|nr:globin [Acidobacteriota bacterium]